MPVIDLVTGFLGAGKTTFLKRYAAWLAEKDKYIGILENDFGAVNVDTMLLKPLESDRIELESVAGGCDADCHRRRFKTKLIAMGMSGYDRVLVEPSGIYETHEFFDVLYEEPLDSWYRIGSVIAVVPAVPERHMSESARQLLGSQLSAAGLVLLSKTDICTDNDLKAEDGCGAKQNENEGGALTPEQMADILAFMNDALQSVGCPRTLTESDVLARDWNHLTDADFERILSAGSRPEAYRAPGGAAEDAFDTCFYMHVQTDVQSLVKTIQDVFADESCGGVLRIKGFLKTPDGYVQINADREQVQCSEIPDGQEIVIVIGEGLQKERLAVYFEGGL